MIINTDVFAESCEVDHKMLEAKWSKRIKAKGSEGSLMLWFTEEAYDDLRNQILAKEFSAE